MVIFLDQRTNLHTKHIEGLRLFSLEFCYCVERAAALLLLSPWLTNPVVKNREGML